MTASRSTSIGQRIDWQMLIAMAGLLLLSFLFIHSASYRAGNEGASAMAVKQTVWALVGLGCYIAMSVLDYRNLKSIHWWLYGGGLLALLLVLFIGTAAHGSRRWFSAGPLTVQPSEFVKLAALITLAAFLGSPSVDTDDLKTFGKALGLALVPFGLILIEPDLGTAAVLIPLALVMLFAAGTPLRPLATLVGAGVLALGVLIIWLQFFPDTCPFLTEYQKSRVLVYLNVNSDPLGAGWNKLQSQIAVGSGGLLGKGYLQGTQNLLGYLPRTVAPTDFIFSVVAEEAGFAGSLLVIGLYGVVVTRCLRTALRASEAFGRLLAAGVGTLIFTHVFVNIAMTAGLMPITGLPLPLMSYGGSFMVSTMLALGLVQSVYLRRRIQ